MNYKPRNAARDLINAVFQAVWKAIKKLFMKKMILIFAIILPLAAFSQCPDLIGATPDKLTWLMPQVQQIFGYELRRSENPFGSAEIFYRDSLNYTRLRIFSKTTIRYEGVNKIESDLHVNHILVTGTADKGVIFWEHLKKILSNCEGYKQQGQWIKAKGMMIIYDDFKGENGVPCYRIDFNIDK